MASGNTLIPLSPNMSVGPSTLAAQMDQILGTSAPAELIPVLAFDQTTAEYADFSLTMPRNYAGTTGVTLTFWVACAVTTNTYVLRAAFRRCVLSSSDLDTTAFTYDYNTTGALTPAGTVGMIVSHTLTFTNGADMDSVVAGDKFLLRIGRAPADANDTSAGDVRILNIEIKES